MKDILLVEDHEELNQLMCTFLSRAGYSVQGVTNGEEALSSFQEEGARLIILDVSLPRMDGFAVCKRLREQNHSMGIIMLTAKSQEMDKVNGLMLGADDYVTKPFSPSELVARVDKIVDVNIRRLRMKIEEEPSSPKYLTTVWGFGYKWVE